MESPKLTPDKPVLKHKFRLVVNSKGAPIAILCDHCETKWRVVHA